MTDHCASPVWRGFEIRFPEADRNEDQDQEYCEIRFANEWSALRLHEYGEIYKHAGLYESIFVDHLKCTSPRTVVGLLRDVWEHRGIDSSAITAIDFGAGNGMIAAELAQAGVLKIIGVDILPEARLAALRDRPGAYVDYHVADFARLDDETRRLVRRRRPNLLITVAALGFGDVPVAAFATAFNMIAQGGWLAFNIRDAFLNTRDRSGFSRLVHAMCASGAIRVEAWKRYVHRLSIHGRPIEYMAIVARKLGDITDSMTRPSERPERRAAHAAPPGRPMIEIVGATVRYDGRTDAIRDMNLSVREGELFALVGESGSGKTTALKLINRLIDATVGTTRVDGRDVRDEDEVQLRRRIGYVFQQVGLFPHLNVAENIAVTLRLLRWNEADIAARVDELLRLVGLAPEEYRRRRPAQLSGGQQQRVGFARALASRPSVLLLDEPFGAIDPIRREALQQDFALIHRRFELTCVLVTHDMCEALLLADRIGVMRAGRLLQVGTPKQLLAAPADEYVASLLEAPRRQAQRLAGMSDGGETDDLLDSGNQEAA